MDYSLRFVDQLRPHLRALRKKRGLTQGQAGALIGVSQARIAEIEANPGAVNFEQLMKLLSVLGASFALHEEDESGPAARIPDVDEHAQAHDAVLPANHGVTLPEGLGSWTTRRMSDQSVLVSLVPSQPEYPPDGAPVPATGAGALLRELQALNPDKEIKPTSRRNFVVREKKGSW
jgi:HTH-type transcriptional regulator/antitoxin HipB